MLVSHDYKFVYIKNRKVAGSSVEFAFQKYCVPPSLYGHYSDEKRDAIEPHSSEHGIVSGRLVPDRAIKPHASAQKIRSVIGADLFDEYYKFSVVRNPYDKVVSWFWYSRHKELSNNLNDFEYIKSEFKEFTRSRTARSDWSLHTIDDKPICDLYIKYESLKEGISQVYRDIGIGQDFKLPKFKGGHRKVSLNYRHYYSDDEIALVSEVFRRELDFFGYSF